MRLFTYSVLTIQLAAANAAMGDVASADGQWRARLAAGGHVLVIEGGMTGAVAHQRALDTRNHVAARAAALISLPDRRSFLIALDGVPELWEVALFEDAGPFHEGFVHSWEAGMEESLAAEVGMFARQRILIEAPVAALAPIPGKRHSVIGTRVDGVRVEINLAVRREVAVLPPE